ncbi:MAG: M48 family metalloprotease [Acidobacteriia bacterium]|nr:M48 family metalloprotease [Terriglobia bacterium]MBV8906408.1 M48 family metalloprotease [Terriglobia bacterium]
MMPRKTIAAAVMLLLAAGLAWGRKPGDPLKPGYNLYSRQQDIQIGAVQASQVKLRYSVVQDEFLETYIKRVGERLANTAEAKQSAFPFQFTLLNVPVVNAFALPGGPMFVFSGLVRSTETEAQLAGVMAHEMSHVILRHGTHELSKAKTTGLVGSLAAALGAAATGNQTSLAQLTRMGVGLGENSVILHFSREAESEADLLGTHLMAEAGYDPKEMARFFEKLGAMGGTGLQFFSDHPNPDNRQRAIEEEIGGLPPRPYGYETGDFSAVKQAVLALPPGGRGPVTSGPPLPPEIAPSGAWKQAHSKTFLVAFPSNWQVYGSAGADSLIVAPNGGVTKAANGAVDLGIGVLLSYFQPESKQMSLGTATLSLVTRLHSQDPTIQLASPEQRSVKVNGSDGLVSLLQASSAKLGQEANVLLTVARPEGIFYALSIAPKSNFSQLQHTFDQILNSIRFEEAPIPSPPNSPDASAPKPPNQ